MKKNGPVSGVGNIPFMGPINPLLDSLTKSGLGAKIGPYPVPAPTCADNVTLVADSPLDLQTMLNIAYK